MSTSITGFSSPPIASGNCRTSGTSSGSMSKLSIDKQQRFKTESGCLPLHVRLIA